VVKAREGVIGISSCVVGIGEVICRGSMGSRAEAVRGAVATLWFDAGKMQGFGGIVDLV